MHGAGVCRKLQGQCRCALRWACLLCVQPCVLGLFLGKEKGGVLDCVLVARFCGVPSRAALSLGY